MLTWFMKTLVLVNQMVLNHSKLCFYVLCDGYGKCKGKENSLSIKTITPMQIPMNFVIMCVLLISLGQFFT